MRFSTSMALLLGLGLAAGAAPAKDYPISPAPFTAVSFEDTFWAPRLETNRKVTVPFDFKKCEETGRIDNFAKAGGLMEGPFKGIRFDDSDVFKVVEGASYSLALHPDPELDAYLDDLIAKFAAAQEEDGYLFTTRTIDPKNPASGAGETRWSHLSHSHELYNVGHMYEAAVAHYQATGKRSLLDIAIKNADLIDRVFGPEKRRDVPGHEEIEIGLAKLYRATGEDRYLKLSKFFLDERGQANGRELYGDYCQDHIPVTQETHAVGHAVRAAYLYSGMADIAALTGDPAYTRALDRIWEDTVSRKLYLTGGIGATRHGERFGNAYELPNATAYNETCAAIANALWNFRMFLMQGDAKYLDVLERIIYNGFLSGVSLSGDAFFYPNPLESDGVSAFNHGSCLRQPWFGCSCCPTNVVRFLPSLPGYVYAQREKTLYVNLFVAGTGVIDFGGQKVRIKQAHDYPWQGDIAITIDAEKAAEFSLAVRIPGWALGRPAPSDLYRYADGRPGDIALSVNGKTVQYDYEKGFAIVHRTWKAGDVLRVALPMPVRRVFCHEAVEANRGCVALERGPMVYCVEGVDNAGQARNLILPDDSPLTAEAAADLLGGVWVLRGPALARHRAESGEVVTKAHDLTAIPYYAWAHRGVSPMRVWLARDPEQAWVAPPPTIASLSRPSASHVHSGDTLEALSDQTEIESSKDHTVKRFTWWDHKGGKEWVAYEFAEPQTVSAVEVYWFDDTGQGSCRVPEGWKLFYQEGEKWSAVKAASDFGVEKDRYNRCVFSPVETTGLRIEARLQDGYSGGLLEWRVE